MVNNFTSEQLSRIQLGSPNKITWGRFARTQAKLDYVALLSNEQIAGDIFEPIQSRLSDETLTGVVSHCHINSFGMVRITLSDGETWEIPKLTRKHSPTESISLSILIL
jgi:hypothetical protein